MDGKPSDFFLGIIDFFGLLLPGAVLASFVAFGGSRAGDGLKSWLGLDNLAGGAGAGWAAFLLAAFIAGHILNGVGSLLFDKPIYDKVFVGLWKRRHGPDPLYKAARSQMAKDLGAEKEITNAYWWAAAVVRTQAPEAIAEVDRLAADSKFFRSLALALAVTLVGAKVKVVLPLVLLIFFSLWRYCELRWKATERQYEYYVLLSRHSEVAAMMKPEGETSGRSRRRLSSGLLT